MLMKLKVVHQNRTMHLRMQPKPHTKIKVSL